MIDTTSYTEAGRKWLHYFITKRCAKPFLLFFGMISITAQGQSSDLGNWMIYFGNVNLGQGWNLHHEVQYRNYDAIGDLEQLLLRTGLGYNLTENNNNILLGYGFIHSENYVSGLDQKVNVDEHRIFQQYIYRHILGITAIQHRLRLEERFIASDFKARWRYFVGINIPLTNRDTGKNSLYLSGYNELFLNLEAPTFDRNRLYGGLGLKLNTDIRFELGYMNQFLKNGSRDQINIIAYLSL